MEQLTIKNIDKFAFKRVTFYPTEIVITRKKEKIVISVDDIETIFYDNPTAINYLIPVLGAVITKIFEIHLKKDINGRKMYPLIVQPKDAEKLQKFFQKEIIFLNQKFCKKREEF